MPYSTEQIYRTLVGHAWQALRTSAGTDDLLCPDEQSTLDDRLRKAAQVVRAETGSEPAIRIGEVLDVYATGLSADIAKANRVFSWWLSSREVDAIEDPKLRDEVRTAQAWVRDSRVRADQSRGPDGLYRRQLAESYTYKGADRVKVAFVDADSTLRTSRRGRKTSKSPNEVVLLPFVGARIAKLVSEGYLIAIVSNQSGVSSGVTPLEGADASLQRVTDLVRAAGGDVHWMDFAENRDGDRKPQIGMALRLERALRNRYGDGVRIDREHSMMVGDAAYTKDECRSEDFCRPGADFSNSDRLFARNLGVDFFEPDEFFGWDQFGVSRLAISSLQRFWTELED